MRRAHCPSVREPVVTGSRLGLAGFAVSGLAAAGFAVSGLSCSALADAGAAGVGLADVSEMAGSVNCVVGSGSTGAGWVPADSVTAPADCVSAAVESVRAADASEGTFAGDEVGTATAGANPAGGQGSPPAIRGNPRRSGVSLSAPSRGTVFVKLATLLAGCSSSGSKRSGSPSSCCAGASAPLMAASPAATGQGSPPGVLGSPRRSLTVPNFSAVPPDATGSAVLLKATSSATSAGRSVLAAAAIGAAATSAGTRSGAGSCTGALPLDGQGSPPYSRGSPRRSSVE